ncbi:MAG: hypothetical protein KGJ05_04825, partial [Alphaproteobacteria bacterium]|nr:hypothetical protein [Alphaproteobacteria bacterium]
MNMPEARIVSIPIHEAISKTSEFKAMFPLVKEHETLREPPEHQIRSQPHMDEHENAYAQGFKEGGLAATAAGAEEI